MGETLDNLKFFFKAFARSLYKSEGVALTFDDVGLHDADEVKASIERYAREHGQTLEFQRETMPMRFTLDGVPYVTARGTGRAGPVVGATRDHDARP